ATATDAAGNAGTAMLTVSIIVSDTTPPVVTFTPAGLTAVSGGTAAVTVTATDNVDGAITPAVTCDAGSFADNTYTAPAVSEDTMATCTATASDDAGNAGTAMLTVSIIVSDTTAPVVTFTPADITAVSGRTAAATLLTATDNVAVTTGPTVTCTRGSFNVEDNTYTAPDVDADVSARCTATAFDAAGNRGRARLRISIIVSDTTPPVVAFSPASLTVDSGGTAMSTLTATDNVAVTSGGVTCDQGSFDPETNTYTAPGVRGSFMDTCTATATDAAGNEGTATLTVSVTADIGNPQLSFSPATLTVDSGGTGSSTFTATDNVGITTGPGVECLFGVFDQDTNTYTAPSIRNSRSDVCNAFASDAVGNEGTATLRVSIVAPDTRPPVLMFIPSDITVTSGGTGSSTFIATDNVGVTTGPDVTCDAGSFANNTYTAPVVSEDTRATCTATASDAAGNEGTVRLRIFVTVAPAQNNAAPAASCPDGFTESSNSPLGDTTLCTGPLGNLAEFAGELTQSATIPYMEGVAYELSGRLDVGQPGPGPCPDDAAPVVLTIEPGVTIVGNSGDDVLVVNRCHRLEAAGTPDRPIVFTSKNDIAGAGERANATGEWGGIVVLGDAPINRCQVPGAIGGTAACENTVEGVTGAEAKYGGGIGDSSSGTFEYVTVRHAGADLGAGLTFGGVGSGTTVNYVQIHNSSGHGMRFRGGRASANYLVLTGNAAGQLGVDEGYEGIVEYMVGVQGGGDSSDNGDNGDNGNNGIEVSDESYLQLYNFTLLAADSTQGSGIRVNGGGYPWFYNGVVVHGNTCLDYEQTAGDGRPGYLPGSDPLFNSVLFDCPDLVTTDTDNGDDPAMGRAAVETPGGNNVVASNTLDG
ncbi:MAG: hypothetical protein GDA39_09720, partial [Hyphomonadaceae bacterium]|nr:hypothetical protein [Hyphomonadaceae bacterium]